MSPEARGLAADFIRHAPRRLAPALALVLIAALLESIGILLLIPMIGLALDGGFSGGFADGIGGWAAGAAERVFAEAGAASPAARMGILLALFAAIVSLRLLVSLRRDLALFDLTQGFIASLRARAFRALAARPWASLARLERDRVGHALCRDVDRVEGGAMAMLGGTVAFAVVAVQGALALAVAPRLALAALVLAGLGFAALGRFRRMAAVRGRRYGGDDLDLYRSTESFLSGLKPAKAHGLEQRYARDFEGAVDRRLGTMRLWLRDQALARLMLQSGAAVAAVAAVMTGVFWLETDPAALIVLVAVIARVWGPLQALQNSIQVLNHAAGGYSVTRDLAAEAPPATDGSSAAPRLIEPPAIRLEAVTVRPDNGSSPLLERVDAAIPAGQVTALTGASGAGKTTLADLAVGLRTPDEGRVLVDGVPLSERAAGLAASLAWVGQESFMPMETLRETLCWGAGAPSDDDIREALELVGAGGLADAVEGGLDGRILSGGMRFSGGERQRLSLARALLRRPKLIVLDEATNALDAESERAVLSRLFAATEATVLMITHRDAVSGLADHRIRLERGRVVRAAPALATA